MKHYSTQEAARILAVSEARVRSFARLGQLAPERGPDGRIRFSFRELLLLQATQDLVEAGVPARRMRRVWSSLRNQIDSDLPLTSVTLFADGERVVAWDGRARWQPDSGQFLLDLEPGRIAAPAVSAATIGERAAATGHDDERDLSSASRIEERAAAGAGSMRRSAGGARLAGLDDSGPAARLALVTPLEPHRRRAPAPTVDVDPPASAEEWFAHACELEDAAAAEAEEAYRQALALDPGHADAHVNLGRLYHEAGELGKAEAHYRDAVRSAPEDAIAHYNLGVLLEDRDRADEALHAYLQALARDAELADAHYNLGLLLERRSRRSEAMGHFMAARRLYARAARNP